MSKVGKSWSFVCFIGIGSTTKKHTEVVVKKLFMWRYEEASQAESWQPSWGLLFDKESNANKQKWLPAMDYDTKFTHMQQKQTAFLHPRIQKRPAAVEPQLSRWCLSNAQLEITNRGLGVRTKPWATDHMLWLAGEHSDGWVGKLELSLVAIHASQSSREAGAAGSCSRIRWGLISDKTGPRSGPPPKSLGWYVRAWRMRGVIAGGINRDGSIQTAQ